MYIPIKWGDIRLPQRFSQRSMNSPSTYMHFQTCQINFYVSIPPFKNFLESVSHTCHVPPSCLLPTPTLNLFENAWISRPFFRKKSYWWHFHFATNISQIRYCRTRDTRTTWAINIYSDGDARLCFIVINYSQNNKFYLVPSRLACTCPFSCAYISEIEKFQSENCKIVYEFADSMEPVQPCKI